MEPRIVDQLYCSTTPGLGDGFKVLRNGAVLAVYGENLFKHGPAVGELIAQIVVKGSTPGEATTAYAV